MILDSFLLLLETNACKDLARLRWGPTGWRCPCCPSVAGTQLRARPRMTQCRECGVQRSVTADTVFGYAKLPVFLLFELLQEAMTFPTASQLREGFAIARSTAWFVMQRVLKILASGFDPGTEVGRVHQHLHVLLRATGRRDLPDGAPAWFQDRQRQRGRFRVPFRVVGLDGLLWLGHLGPGDSQQATAPTVFPRLAEHVSVELERVRRVSLRWGPRWIAGVVAAHAFRDLDFPLDFWALRGLRLDHVPRARFEPWRSPGPW